MAPDSFIALVADEPGFENRFGRADNLLDRPECLIDVSYGLSVIVGVSS